MRVSFVNVNVKRPGDPASRELEFYDKKCSIELGTLYLDANTPWRPEDRVQHINILFHLNRGEDWQRMVVEFAPDVVAISGLTHYAPELVWVAQWVKDVVGCPVVAGGPHVTAVREVVLDEDAIDYAIEGEGEPGFPALMNWLRTGQGELADVPGLIYRDDEGKARCNGRSYMPDLNELRYPTRAQVDPWAYGGYTSLLNLKVDYVPIVTTRGCPYRCVYCHDIMGKAVRYRSPDSVLDEIDYWSGEGIDTFLVYDDIFNIHRGRVHEIFTRIKNRGRKLRFAFPNGLRADLLDEELVELLVDGGTFYTMVAVESGDARVQKVIKKRLHLDRTRDVIRMLGDAGIIVGAFNILGFPSETEADIARTIEFNETAEGLTKANFFVLNPHVGTEVWDMAVAEGYDPANGNNSGYFSAHNTSPTSHVSGERLEELRNEAYRRFYLSPGRLDRVLDQSPRNMTALEKAEFHAVDYSFVMRQFLGLSDTTVVDPAVRTRLDRLLPSGPLATY